MSKNKEELRAKQRAQQARKQYLDKLKPLIYAFASWFALLAILHLPPIKDVLREIMVGFTHRSALVAGKILFLPISDKGSPILDYGGFGMRVILECTAYNFYLFALMISVFSQWSTRHKLINLFLFIASVFVMNNARFLIMGAIGKHHPHLFHHIHDYFWNIFFGLLIFLIYIWADQRAGGVFANPPKAQN